MLSLEIQPNEEDLRDFDAQVKKLTGIAADQDIVYAVELNLMEAASPLFMKMMCS